MSLFFFSLGLAVLAHAETVTLTLQKQDGTPLENAVAYVEASQLTAPVPASAKKDAKETKKGPEAAVQAAVQVAVQVKEAKAEPAPALPEVVVAQREQEFVPVVAVVPKGAEVRFTNEDKVQHNIYSFSSVEKLNFPLHAAGTVNTKSFRQVGEVELGCNIHDWMQAHLYVVDSPVYGVSGKDGKVTLTGVPASGAIVTVWHPYLRNKKPLPTIQYQPGKALDPLRLQVKSVKKPPRESY